MERWIGFNKELENYQGWNPADITVRALTLSQIAYSVLRLPS